MTIKIMSLRVNGSSLEMVELTTPVTTESFENSLARVGRKVHYPEAGIQEQIEAAGKQAGIDISRMDPEVDSDGDPCLFGVPGLSSAGSKHGPYFGGLEKNTGKWWVLVSNA